MRNTGSGWSDTHRSQPRRRQEPDAHAEDHAQQRDLEAHQHGAQGDRPWGLPERHAYAELAPLRLHDPAREVEGSEHGGPEDQEGDRVHGPSIALQVSVQAAPRRVVFDRRDRRRERGEGCVERDGEPLPCHGPVDPRIEPDDQVVHHARSPASR